MAEKMTKYYVPDSSPWPLSASIGLFLIAIGGANFIQQSTEFGQNTLRNTGTWGQYPLILGALWLIAVLFFWWRDTIRESVNGLHSDQLGGSYRQGMIWFIFSEVMFFGALFGALFYTRWLIIPWLGGEGSNAMTHEILWPDFQAIWPLTTAPDGRTTQVMGAWGLPAINTAILIVSSITLTIAHHALVAGERGKLILFQGLTIVLGLIFLSLQALEYVHAYDMGLTLDAGMYGSLFFFLTGFHGIHVTLGTIMLIVMFFRILKGHFSKENHFAYEATAWYWHFVDIVWLFLFVVVYWL
ncbi:MAG: cytochrome c oxidase subunit 3 [Gammaproteobacteria bacterium HGW-Gammaproteobacteria-14]|nr:MAG: cytochrome c oxidase subunit 3 [Gammaproteobacteria bacterium HGW-Gammaproteobacteria-14]